MPEPEAVAPPPRSARPGLCRRRKTDYHQLAQFARAEDLDDEVRVKLDRIVEVARQALPER